MDECEKCKQCISSYFDGDESLILEIKEHLSHCEDCREFMNLLSKLENPPAIAIESLNIWERIYPLLPSLKPFSWRNVALRVAGIFLVFFVFGHFYLRMNELQNKMIGLRSENRELSRESFYARRAHQN